MDIEKLRAAARAVEPPLDEPELEASPPPRGDLLLTTFVESMSKIAGKTADAITASFDKTWEEVSGEKCAPGVGYARLYERMTKAFTEAAVAMLPKAPDLSPAALIAKEAASIAVSSGVTMEEATRSIIALMGRSKTLTEAEAPPIKPPFKLDDSAVLRVGGVSIATATNVTNHSDGIEFEFTSAPKEAIDRMVDCYLTGGIAFISYKGLTYPVDREWMAKFGDAMLDGIAIGFEWSEPIFKDGRDR